jgi:hypothetical protein
MMCYSAYYIKYIDDNKNMNTSHPTYSGENFIQFYCRGIDKNVEIWFIMVEKGKKW